MERKTKDMLKESTAYHNCKTEDDQEARDCIPQTLKPMKNKKQQIVKIPHTTNLKTDDKQEAAYSEDTDNR